MASDITIGGVGIIISGDYSKLQADFLAAQALATRAGAGIATGLTAGMAPAVAGASGAVEKFGLAIKESGAAAQSAAVPFAALAGQTKSFSADIDRLIQAIGNENAALSLSIQRNMALAAATKESGRVAGEAKSAYAALGEKAFELATELGITLGALEAVKEAFGVYAEVQKLTVTLTALTGSAEKTNEVVEQMEALATSQALAFPQLLPAAQRMIAMGFSINQVVPAMAAAGNASWALGESIEVVSARMAGLALSGMAMPRMLRELGLSSEDLARALGVSEQELKGVFKALPEEDRIAALTVALEKFKGTAAAGAGTISGAWIVVKNTFHELFAEIGENSAPAIGFMERFAQTTGNFLRDTFSNKAGVDSLKNLIEAASHGKSYEEVSRASQPKAAAPLGVLPEEGSGFGPIGAAKAVFDAQGVAAKLHAKEQAANTLARIANAERENEQTSELARAAANTQIELDHQVRRAEIDANTDAGTRAVASAAERVRVEKEKAEQIGAIDKAQHDRAIQLLSQRIGPELAGKYEADQDPTRAAAAAAEVQTTIAGLKQAADAKYAAERQKLDSDLAKAEGDTGIKGVEAQRGWAEQVTREWEKAFAAIRKDAQHTFEEENAPGAYAVLAAQRVAEVQAKGKGPADSAAIEKQKLQAEQAYGLQVIHTGAQQVAYAQQLAAFDARERAAKITDLNEQLRLAQVDVLAAGGTEKQIAAKEEVARLVNQIAEETAKSDNAQIAAQTKILELIQKQTLEYKLKAAFVKAGEAVPGAIGGAVAGGLFNSGKQGMDIGKQITDSLKNVGQQLAGTIFRELIGEIVKEIAAHTVLGAIFTWFGSTQTTAVSLNTAQLVILNGLLIKQQAAAALSAAGGAAGAGGGIAGAAGGAAGAAGGAASSAATGLVGPLIAAAGGIIGGVISGVMSLIGDRQIVTAIHGTTAAVQALHGTVSGTGGPVTSGVPAPAATALPASGGASQDGMFGFLASILGFGGSSKPVDVNIVSTSPLSPLNGLAGLFGFASGGRPPVGVASIVGEKGPELFIPDQAGQIVAAGKFGGAGLDMPAVSSSISSQTSSMNNTFHVYGVQNARDLVRQIPALLKSTWPGYSPASR
jgi:hypothetical protein